MDKPTNYVEVRVLPLDGDALSGGDVAFVTTRIMAAVHLHIVEGNEVAVAFPYYRTKALKSEKGDLVETVGTGSMLRIFGDSNSLMSFLVRPDFAQLIGGAACSVGKNPIRTVPEDANWEIFSRNRCIERKTPSYIERSATRLEARAESGRGKSTTVARQVRHETLAEASETRLPPYVQMDSLSTSKRFRLFINRDVADHFVAKSPSTYGLGVTVPSF